MIKKTANIFKVTWTKVQREFSIRSCAAILLKRFTQTEDLRTCTIQTNYFNIQLKKYYVRLFPKARTTKINIAEKF